MWLTLLASGFQSFASIRADEEARASPSPAHADVAGDATVEDAASSAGAHTGDETRIPSAEQLLAALDSMTGLSDEEKASIRDELINGPASGGAGGLPVANDNVAMQTIILFSLLGLVALIFVFFVYKLFRCLQERERKREEKKKNKQLRKKK